MRAITPTAKDFRSSSSLRRPEFVDNVRRRSDYGNTYRSVGDQPRSTSLRATICNILLFFLFFLFFLRLLLFINLFLRCIFFLGNGNCFYTRSWLAPTDFRFFDLLWVLLHFDSQFAL